MEHLPPNRLLRSLVKRFEGVQRAGAAKTALLQILAASTDVVLQELEDPSYRIYGRGSASPCAP